MRLCDCGSTDLTDEPGCIALTDPDDDEPDMYEQVLAEDGYRLPRPRAATLRPAPTTRNVPMEALNPKPRTHNHIRKAA